MVKVCIVNTSSDTFGHPIPYMNFLSTLFKESGYEVFIKDLSKHPMTQFILPAKDSLGKQLFSLLKNLSENIKKHNSILQMSRNYDIMYFHGSGGLLIYFLSVFYSKKTVGKFIFTHHDSAESGIRVLHIHRNLKQFIWKVGIRLIASRVKAIVVLEECYKEYMIQHYGVKSEYIHVLPNYYLPEYSPEANKNNKLGSIRDVDVLFIGTIQKAKGVDIFVDVLSDVRVPLKVMIAGGMVPEKDEEFVNQLNEKINGFKNPLVGLHFIFRHLERDEYEYLISIAKTVIFPYRVTRDPAASGVFWDVMKFGKPIIAPYQPPFQYYFDTYNIGVNYLPDDKESLFLLLSKFHKINWKEYASNIEIMRKDYSKEQLIRRMNEIL